MTILTMFEIHGDPEDIAAIMDTAFGEETKSLAAEHGGISNTVARTENGVLVVNHWESEEGMEAFAAIMRPKAEAAGPGEQVDWRMYEVVRHRTPQD
jgi:heme-degrading monooxygenase HmoA